MTCIFCHSITAAQILTETAHFKVVFDIDPIQQGHVLILSKEHLMDLRELSEVQLLELHKLEKAIITIFEQELLVDGVSVIQNNGAIMDEGTHFHVHLVPRYKGDNFWEHHIVNQKAAALETVKLRLKRLAK